LAFVLALGLGITLASAQDQQTFTYQPVVGQPGKDVVWVPTPEELVEKMLDLAKVTPQDFVIDLGSGDGRTVIAAAKRGARALGIEYNPDMVELSRLNAAQAGVSERAQFIKADLFESDFSQASVITMFLLPDINMRLRPKLLSLKPGTRVVSNSFTMEDWEPDDRITVEGSCTSWCTAYLWIVPAKVEGKWNLPQGEMTLQQAFQMISGTMHKDGRSIPLRGRLRGEEITFTAGDAEYIGRVNGDHISLRLKNASGAAELIASRERP